MTIEVHDPELQILIEQRMATGRFQSVEDTLLSALRFASEATLPEPGPHLADILARARFLLDGEELDLTRDPSPGRDIDLS